MGQPAEIRSAILVDFRAVGVELGDFFREASA
jgi:hypothetical protein